MTALLSQAAMSHHTSLSLLLLLLWMPTLILSTPANVTVQANDPNLIYAGTGTYSPTNMYGGPKNIFTLCQEYVTAATDTAGNSVSLNFTGTAVSYTFLLDHDGSTAQILIDGQQVDAVNTNNATTEADTNCFMITKSVAVTSGTHTITAVNQVTTGQFVMYFLNFAYTPVDPSTTSASQSSSTSAAPTPNQSAPTPANTSTSTNHTPIIAGAVGGVIGLLFFLAAIFYVRKRRQNHVVDLIDNEEGDRGDREGSALTGAYRDRSPGPEHDDNATTVSPFMTANNIAPASTLTAQSFTSKPATTSSKAVYKREAEAAALESSAAHQGVDPAFIREMMQHNVPGPEIATMIRAMAARQEQEQEGQSSSATVAVDDAGGMVPPPYDFVARGPER
ncbi:hypothetical protein FRB97_007312 [Tulasnella sp. 331]|nr:hypothetical protein FRB97_007312 [Tulasnella sp. 331]